MSSTSTTADLYRFIVSEVIGQVRETFVDEGVDPEVLDTLRQVGIVDFVFVAQRFQFQYSGMG